MAGNSWLTNQCAYILVKPRNESKNFYRKGERGEETLLSKL